MSEPRSGQWVKFQANVPEGAHKTKDGFVVGIYQRAGRSALGQDTPARVVLVNAEGMNIPGEKDGALLAALWLPPAECKELQPVLNVNEVPEKRRRAGWKPRR